MSLNSLSGISYHNQMKSRYSLNEELRTKWERLWHFFSVSQQFGEWGVNFKNASEEERDLIIKTQEILTKYGVMPHPELLKTVFNSLTESEKYTCLNGLEIITKYMKYNYGGLNIKRESG